MANTGASKYSDLTFNLKDTYEGRPIEQSSYIHLSEAKRTVSCIAFVPPEGILLAGSLDASVRVYETDSSQPFLVFKGHKHSVRGVVHLREKVVASIDDYGNIITWNAQRGQAIDSHNIFKRPLSNVLSNGIPRGQISFVEDKQGVYSMEKLTNNVLVVGTMQCFPVYVVHDRQGSSLSRFNDHVGYSHAKLITDTASYGDHLVTASSDKTIVIRSIRHRSVLCKIELDASVLSTAMNARYIAAGCNNGNLYIFRKSNYKLECILEEKNDLLLTMSFIENDVLMTGGTSGCVSFISVSGKCYLSRVVVQKDKYIYSAIVLPNSRIAVGGGKGNSIPLAAVFSAPPEIESILNDRNLLESSMSSDISNEISKVKLFVNEFGYDVISNLRQLVIKKTEFNCFDVEEEKFRARKLLTRAETEDGLGLLVRELRNAVDPFNNLNNEVKRLNDEITELSKEFEDRIRDLRASMDALEQSLDDPVCIFCLETILPGDVVVRLECMHLFHRDCAMPYFRQQFQPCCPIDRRMMSRSEVHSLRAFIYSNDEAKQTSS